MLPKICGLLSWNRLPPPPKTKKRRVRRFFSRVVLRRRQEEEPPPKLAGRKPLAFAVAAREAETGSLEPFLFRTYPREQGTAPGRSDVKLWQAVAATCAAPAVFAPVQIDGESYVDGGVVANDPTLLALAEVASVFPGRPVGVVVSLGCGQTKRERRAERREERRWFRRRKSKKAARGVVWHGALVPTSRFDLGPRAAHKETR